jgi:hypothetical protein
VSRSGNKPDLTARVSAIVRGCPSFR